MLPKKISLPAKLVRIPTKLRARWRNRVSSTVKRRLALGLAAAAAALIVALALCFFWPRTLSFSFANNNCFFNPIVLPGLIAKDQGDVYTATPQKTIAIAGYPLYSHATCVHAQQAPQADTQDSLGFKVLGIPFLQKGIRVTTNNLPTVEYQTVVANPIATNDTLTFPLDGADRVFTYQLLANQQIARCTHQEQSLQCDTAPLTLQQSATYTLTMQRLFNETPTQTVFEAPITTVSPLELVSTTIAPGQTVFDRPNQLTLTFNKNLQTFEGVELTLIANGTRTAIPITVQATDSTITVQFAEALARSSHFELSVPRAKAIDGGYLPTPLVIPFATSGGPKVTGVNIGTYKVATGSNIILTFDASPSANQNLANFIKLEVNGSAAAASISRSGNRITINPAADFPKCARLTVRVLDGLENEFGIAGGSAWSLNARAICQSVFSIGASVQGRNLLAYRFGTGSSMIVFVGGTHGNEKSSVVTLNSFIDHMERNPDVIPAHRSIVIIPNINPDGFAASSRTNARNVDLNRNFPANDWKQDVTMPGGAYNAGGGGSAPLSEPESASLASYILSVQPRLVLTYHAVTGVVIPNGSGDSDALARIYDQKSNLSYSTGAGLFNYDTTGAFEDWLRDKHGMPALLLELRTMTTSEFSKNQNAMLHMVGLP